MLARSGLITTRNECCKRGSTSGLGNYPQCLPKSQLGTLDRVVRNQDYVVHMLLGDGVHERADAAGCERIRRYATSRGVDRFSCLERHHQRWGGFGLDSDHLDLIAKPRRNSGNQPAAANRDEQSIEIRDLILDLQPGCSLAQQCFALVEGVDRERP